MSREFDDQLRASLERELSAAYLVDDNPRLARYQALSASGAGEAGAGRMLSTAAPAARLWLAALMVVGAVVVSGAAVVDASRSSQGLVPLLQPASGRHRTVGVLSTAAPADPAAQALGAAATSGPDSRQPRLAPVDGGTRQHRDGDQEARRMVEPAPSPEHHRDPSPDAVRKIEPVPQSTCTPQPHTPARSSPEAPAPPRLTEGRPPGQSPREPLPTLPRDQCG